MQRLPTPVAALGLVIAAVAVVGWWGAIAVGPAAGPDAAEHIRYAEYFDTTGHLPPKSENYEYASPPAYQVAAVYLQRAARTLSIGDGALVPFLPAPVRRVGWFVLLEPPASSSALRSASRRNRIAAGLVVAALLIAALVAALARARGVPWSAGQLISLVSACGLVAVTWALAREAMPGRHYLPLLAAGVTAVLPVVLREGVIFHPELPFAFVVSAAVLVFARGARAGWGAGTASRSARSSAWRP